MEIHLKFPNNVICLDIGSRPLKKFAMFWKIFLALLALVLALVPTWITDSKERLGKRSKLRNWTITALSCLTAAGMIFEGYDDQNDKLAAEYRATQAESVLKGLTSGQQSQSAMMQKISAGLGDEESYAEFFKTTEKLIKQIAQTQSKDFLGDIERAAAETVDARGRLQLENSRAQARIQVQWGPLYSYIYSSFDAKIIALEKGGYVESKSENPKMLLADSPNLSVSVRSIKFPGGPHLSVIENPMVLRGGKIASPYMLYFQYSKNEGGGEFISTIKITEKGLQLAGPENTDTIILSDDTVLETEENMKKVETLISAILMRISLDSRDKAPQKLVK